MKKCQTYTHIRIRESEGGHLEYLGSDGKMILRQRTRKCGVEGRLLSSG